MIKFDRVEIAASAYYTTMKFRRGQARQAKISSIKLFGYFPSVQQNILMPTFETKVPVKRRVLIKRPLPVVLRL